MDVMVNIKRQNNFGFLRLLFATLVIVSHSAEIIDGNRSREALTSLFGALTFGELAVDGFFLISGYLVAKSWENSASNADYVLKRVRRIYPGFLVAFLICVFMVGPFVGANIRSGGILKTISDAAFLRPPRMQAFIGLSHPSLNGSMWTIAVEFRCYLLVILLGTLGVYKSKKPLLILAAVLLALNEISFNFWMPSPVVWAFGEPLYLFRLFGIFCVGSLYYVYRESIPYNGKIAAGAVCALLFFLFQSILAESAFAILGGYLIFWLALHFKSRILRMINGRDDISYGVYLYAWPIQSSLVYFFHIKSPWLLIAATILICFPVAYASWRFVEKAFLPTIKADSTDETLWQKCSPILPNPQ
jgi:peptidoglycan/LPS O-acetylase OafA/YrhL